MKHNPHLKSIFAQISEKVFSMKSLDEAKQFVTSFVEGKDINENDKKSILKEVNDAKSLVRFQNYICNALLKFEGLGMNNFNKTPKDETPLD